MCSPVLLEIPSQYETTGSETVKPAPRMYSSFKSFKQISKCNSPAPAIMCSPVFPVNVFTRGSDFDNRFKPSTSFERSGVFVSGNSTTFQNVLVNTNQTNHVSARTVSQLFDVSSHHKKGSLNLLDVQISLLSELVVRSVNSDGLTGADGSGEHSSEGNESSFFSGWNHL